jgi:hypothetical protein
MGLDGYSFLFGLLLVPFTFLFFPKIYFNKKLVIPFFIIALTLAIIGLTVKTDVGATKPNFYLFLLCPIFSLTLLRIELTIFQKKLNRYPNYPPRNWFIQADGFGADRLFYFVFILLSIAFPFFLLAYFHS